MSINSLNQGTPTLASQIPYNDPSVGQDRRTSLSQIVDVIESSLSASGFITQYASPGATGFSVTIAPPASGTSTFLLLSPGATYAAGTVVLPTGVDGQEILVHSRQTVTALTVSVPTGASASGAPTTITAGGFFRMRFDGVNSLWCRVG